jgi:hypothetical protein
MLVPESVAGVFAVVAIGFVAMMIHMIFLGGKPSDYDDDAND